MDVTEQGPLARWVAEVAAEFGLDVAGTAQTRLVLDLARDVAHTVDRPAAPMTAYLLGLAVGAGGDPEQAAARIRTLLERWPTG
jgi:uncharacterized protein DUF6457